MLKVKNLHAGISGKEILKGVDLSISPGEIHAVMGRNGSGKSTLSNVITGKDGYVISKGDIEYKDESIVEWSPEKRALAGIFMSFQYPVVMPGVNNTYFLKAALNSKLKNNGKKELNAAEFLKLVKEKLNELDMDTSYLQRAVNEGFSGGEKKTKRNKQTPNAVCTKLVGTQVSLQQIWANNLLSTIHKTSFAELQNASNK